MIHSTYSFFTSDDPQERDLFTLLIFPFLLWRMIHNQIWISLSRYRTAKGNNRIVDKGLEFEQVDRERNWSVHYILCISSKSKLRLSLIIDIVWQWPYIGVKTVPYGHFFERRKLNGFILAFIMVKSITEIIFVNNKFR